MNYQAGGTRHATITIGTLNDPHSVYRRWRRSYSNRPEVHDDIGSTKRLEARFPLPGKPALCQSRSGSDPCKGVRG